MDSILLTYQICIVAKGHALHNRHYYQAFAFSQALLLITSLITEAGKVTLVFHCLFVTMWITITTYEYEFNFLFCFSSAHPYLEDLVLKKGRIILSNKVFFLYCKYIREYFFYLYKSKIISEDLKSLTH